MKYVLVASNPDLMLIWDSLLCEERTALDPPIQVLVLGLASKNTQKDYNTSKLKKKKAIKLSQMRALN